MKFQGKLITRTRPAKSTVLNRTRILLKLAKSAIYIYSMAATHPPTQTSIVRSILALLEKPSRVAVLLLLLVQNTGLALAVKGSKLSGSQYIASTAVLLNELAKFLLSAVFYYILERPRTSGPLQHDDSFVGLLSKSENLLFVVRMPGKYNNWKVPCVIYATQNNLVFVALELIDAALYQVHSFT